MKIFQTLNKKIKKQICIYRGGIAGDYYNFFFTPGSIDSFRSYIIAGWRVVFIKDDPTNEKVTVLFERDED